MGRSSAGPTADAGTGTCNDVALVGRVSAPAEERTLPSGDVLLTWRVIVDRPPPRRAVPEGVRQSTVDVIDCVAWTGGVRRTAGAFDAGDVVRVEGSLRRRFWRGGAGGLASKYEVEVKAARRLAQASR
jgi:single-strand DNA-binding protein